MADRHSPTFSYATVVEEKPVTVLDKHGKGQTSLTIRIFSLSLNGVSVELTSLGACLSKWKLPRCKSADELRTKIVDDDDSNYDDIVLGYASPLEMWCSDNPNYFSVTVGRVANRIANGTLHLNEEHVYQLDCNDPPNHLHGGYVGFSRRIWEACIVECFENGSEKTSHKGVQFALVSDDGDQGYPGSVRVTATYFLKPSKLQSPERGDGNDEETKLTLSLKLQAELSGSHDPEKTLCTPINLTHHSYFNLASHKDPRGVLDHQLTLNCDAYTPVNDTKIPTRQVLPVSNDSVMDFTRGQKMADALRDFGKCKAGLTDVQAERDVTKCKRVAPDLARSEPDGIPYGYDHNYVVNRANADGGLCAVGTLEHEPTRRKLIVRSDAPGVQLYTGNFLDGTVTGCKDDAIYAQWQGVCLEMQHFPDSILQKGDEHQFAEFAKGRCVILSSQTLKYEQNIEYEVAFRLEASDISSASEAKKVEVTGEGNIVEEDGQTESCPSMPAGLRRFRGKDAHGTQYYASPDEMWLSQGVVDDTTAREAWYDRAAQYYEDNCPATINGVLGGFASISDLDLEGSRDFVEAVKEKMRGRLQLSAGAACECGAGIGRVTKGLLLSLGVTRCDLVESSARLLSNAPDFIGEESIRCRFFCSGLQEWFPAQSTYSIMWIQWVLCYLTDDNAVAFLRRCGKALIDHGCIIIKENTCTEEDFVLDEQDASVTRSVAYLKHLATQAGLKLILERRQTNFPSEIFPVPMLAFEVDR